MKVVNGCVVPVEKLGLARLRDPVLRGKRRDLGDDVSLYTLEKEDSAISALNVAEPSVLVEV
jgi:hypothetical protein